jgi:hypothetical protein
MLVVENVSALSDKALPALRGVSSLSGSTRSWA